MKFNVKSIIKTDGILCFMYYYRIFGNNSGAFRSVLYK